MSIEIGQKATFKGYGELEEGQEEILEEGETVTITGYSEEEDLYNVETDDERMDTAFAEELEAIEEEEEAEEEAPKPARSRKKAPAKKAPAKKAPAKSKAKAKDEEAEDEAPAKKTTAKKAPAKKAPAKKAPAKAKAAPKEDPVKALVVADNIAELVSDDDTAIASAEELAESLTEQTEAAEVTKFQLGGVLAYVKAHELYKEQGFEKVEDFCEQKLGLKARSCQYYILTYTSLTEAGITDAEIEKVGMTKLREIAGVVDKKNRRGLIGKASKLSRDDLQAHVRDIKAGKASPTDKDAPARVKVPAMNLFKDQGETLLGYIEEAKKLYEVDNMGEALYFAMTDWAQSKQQEVSTEEALEAFNAEHGTDFALED